MVLPDLEVRALAGERGLIFRLSYIRDIALVIYEIGRALDAEAALFLPVDGGDVPPEFVGDPLGLLSIVEAGFNP